MNYSWVPLMGVFEDSQDGLIFKGREVDTPTKEPEPVKKTALVGQALCDQKFAEGTISTEVTFADGNEFPSAELVLFYDPNTKAMITAGLGWTTVVGMFSLRQWNGKAWSTIAEAGAIANLKNGRRYKVAASLRGSFVTLTVDGVDVISANIPVAMSESQVGVFCLGKADIVFHNFEIQRRQPKAFVVMQFTPPYDELYADVIKPVCREMKLEPHRADETFSPGLIIADVIRQILESKLIIAEITPANPNVYYEVGFAHAMNKPTILIADKGTKLPFDVSPFRTLFYENSIGGKKRIEDGLRSYLNTIISSKAVFSSNP
jgi:hypothetical protein